jgi:hypothetical protein
MASFNLNSETHKTVSSISKLYSYLSDFKNFKSILPEDKVVDFQADGDSCTFTIKGVTKLSVRIAEKNENKRIKFETEGLAKFNFILYAHFIGEPEAKGECRVDMEGDMNPFILQMAKKPLEQLINTMSEKMAQLKL